MPRVLRAQAARLALTVLPLCACVGNVEGELPQAAVPPGSNSGGHAGTGPAEPAKPLARERLHRLNRLEYDNTVRDLLGTSLAPARGFPADASLDGFDNFAEGLSLPPALLDLYWSAARDLAEQALRVAPRYRQRFEAKSLGVAPGYAFGGAGFALAGTSLSAKLELPQAETVTLTVLAGGTSSQAPRPSLDVRVDGAAPHSFVVEALPSAPLAYAFSLDLAAGSHELSIGSDNYVNLPADNVTNQLVISDIEARGAAEIVPPARARIYVCEPSKTADPVACYQSIVARFAERAYRRPLGEAERHSLSSLWQGLRRQEGDDEATLLTVRAVLSSSSFLFRPSFAGGGAADERGLVPLDDYSLASRLSYFLWSSMPDDALFDAARTGALHDEQALGEQLRRMLADPRAEALRQGFAAQWLNARALEHLSKDPLTYPDFDDELRQAMIDEVGAFFGDFRSSGQPVARFLSPGFGFVNDRLARHYGLPEPGSSQLTRITLPPGARGGVLFQGAWLAASSEANRTSPVKRGRFLLERILCRDVPPPPANVPPFDEPTGDVTVRERLAQHRASPACSGCHNLLDPIGLGFEELDGIGKLRSSEAGEPVDTSGAAPADADSAASDVPYVGATQLVRLLENDSRFARCLTRKLYGYALGRRVDAADEPFLAAMATSQSERSTLPDLLSGIARSAAFTRQIAQEPAP
jgi:hypothetical protein